ncbi:hypothetical protein ABZ904_29245 [Streptomyces sp. NPDC046900]|uniref:hypothetical protein n=1 Tax=Streptomyces sp. NPDC046900 TaxID=3155473 RepID=UPI0034014050
MSSAEETGACGREFQGDRDEPEYAAEETGACGRELHGDRDEPEYAEEERTDSKEPSAYVPL